MRLDFKKIAIILLSCVVLSCSMPLSANALNPEVSEGFVNQYFSGFASYPAFQLCKLLALYGVNVDYSDIGLFDYTQIINSMDSYTFINTLGQTTKLSDAVSAISAVGGGSILYLFRNVYNPTTNFGTCFKSWISDYFGDSVGDTGVIGFTNEIKIYPAGIPLHFSGYRLLNNQKVTFDLNFCYKTFPFIVFALEEVYPGPINQELANKHWGIYVIPAYESDFLTLTSDSAVRSSFQYTFSTDPISYQNSFMNVAQYWWNYNYNHYYTQSFNSLYQATYLYDYDFTIYKVPHGTSVETFINQYYSKQVGVVTAPLYDVVDPANLPDPDTDSGRDFYDKYFNDFQDEAYYFLSSSITNNYVSSVPETVQYVNDYVTNNYNLNITLPDISDLVDFNVDFGSAASDYIDSEHGLFTSANSKIADFESTMTDLELLPGLLSGISFCSTFISDFFYASGGSTGGYGIIFGLSVTFLLLSLIIGVSSFIGKGGK